MAFLDAEIADNDLLMSISLIWLITIGGSLAVRLCRNRKLSYDIDYILDPNIAAVDDYANDFALTVTSVATKGSLKYCQ